MRQVITISIDNKLLPRIDEKVKEKRFLIEAHISRN